MFKSLFLKGQYYVDDVFLSASLSSSVTAYVWKCPDWETLSYGRAQSVFLPAPEVPRTSQEFKALPLCPRQRVRSGTSTILPWESGILHHPGLSVGGWGPWQSVNLQWGLKPMSAIELFCYLDWGLAPLWIWCRKWLRNPPWQALSLSRNHSDLTHLTVHSKWLY